jgi:hypothetical protein
MIRLYFNKIINRIRMALAKIFEAIIRRLMISYTRNQAHILRRTIYKKRGIRFLDRKTKKTIKQYARQRFGKASYWPYLALYTEIRGKFIKGWIPADYYRFTLLPKINPVPSVHFDALKTFDYRLFGDFAVKPLLLFINGFFYNSDLELVEQELVDTFMSEYGDEIVIKEEGGWGGEQVRVIDSSRFKVSELNKLKNYVIQPYVRQYKVLNDLYPHSVNTLRVNTFIRKNGCIEVMSVWLRFGGDGRRVDNLTSGGGYLYFHQNGIPESISYDLYTGIEKGDRHQDTGYIFSDIKIPMFKKVLDACKNAHKKYTYVRLIAWDVCIDSSGEPKLLEWNSKNPEFPYPEAKFGPFWYEDEEI